MDSRLPALSQLLAQCYKDGFVPPEVSAVVSLTLPNVSWLGLSLPYHDHASNTRYMVTVNNLAESGAPHMACLASADTAASVAIRNAVPCISSTYGAVCVLFDDVCTAVGIVNTPRLSHNSPSYEDLVAAFDEKHQCGVVITIPIGSKPSHTLTPSGVRTQSGPAVAALSVGYAAGEPVSESDLLTASYIAAYISPYVIVLLESFLPELMRDCACDADTCATRRVRGGDGNEPPSASALRAHAGADAMAALPALDCLEPLLMLDNVRGDGAPRANQAHGSAHRMVLHPVWTAAWFNMRRHGRPATSQLASTMLQSLTFDEKVDDDHTAAEHPQVARTSSSAPVAQRDDLAGALRQAMASTGGAAQQRIGSPAPAAPAHGDGDTDMMCSASSASAGDACRMEVLLPAGSSVVAL